MKKIFNIALLLVILFYSISFAVEPTELPVWDENDTNTIPISTELQDDGFSLRSKPASGTFNSWFRNVYKWTEWFQEKFGLVDAAIYKLAPADSIADLRAITYTPEDGSVVDVLGYDTPGDGGGGLVYWDATSTDSEDGGTVFKVTSIATGRFKRSIEGIVNAKKFGIFGDGLLTQTEVYDRSVLLWTYCLANGFDFKFDAGTYEIGNVNFPWRQETVASLLDCKNITLYCDGPATIFRTVSPVGADVFQLNGLKNFHVKGFPTLTGVLTATGGAGSNGCSVVNGYDNITLEISPTNCQGIDKTTYIDGGRGLTIQTPGSGQTLEVGSIKATVFAKGCTEGFGYEPDLVSTLTKKTAIDVTLFAEDCHIAVKVVSGAASGALTEDMGSGLKVRGKAINCQKDIALNRCHGGDIDLQVVTTKTEAERRLDSNGVTWFAGDTIVESIYAVYAKRTKIKVAGNKGACEYKIRIGGTSAGSSGLNGSSEYCDFNIDLGGAASTSDFAIIDFGGNTARLCELSITSITSSTIPVAWFTPALKNMGYIDGVYQSTFTATIQNTTDTPTFSVAYSVISDSITFDIPATTGTSNSDFFTISGIPIHLRPTTAQRVIINAVDNGAGLLASAVIETDGTATIYNAGSTTASTWTTSGLKGFTDNVISYKRF